MMCSAFKSRRKRRSRTKEENEVLASELPDVLSIQMQKKRRKKNKRMR